MGEVIEVGGSISVPAGDLTDEVVTRDWNPLEPDAIEQKTYAPRIGLAHEEKVAGDTGTGVLIEHT